MSSYNSKYYNGFSPTSRPELKTTYQAYENPYANRSYGSELEYNKSGGYYPSKANIVTTTFAPSYSYTPIEYSKPYDLNHIDGQEKAKKSTVTYGPVESNITKSLLYEPKTIYQYEEKPQTSYIYEERPQNTYQYEDKAQTYQPQKTDQYEEKLYFQKTYQYEEKPYLYQKSDLTPYDYRTYNPGLSYSPATVEKTKKVQFYDYKVPEYKISSQLDEMKYKLGEIKEQISHSPHLYERGSTSRPRIFEYQKISDVTTQDLRLSSPLYLEKAEFIKRSGKSPTKSPATSPLLKSYSHKGRIFSPLTISHPIPDTNLILKSLDTPKTQQSFHKELPKKHINASPKYESYGKTASGDVVVPSQIPLHYGETARILENKPRFYESSYQTVAFAENKPRVYESTYPASDNYDLRMEQSQYYVEEKPKMSYYLQKNEPNIEKNQYFIENSGMKIIEKPQYIQSNSLQRRGTDNFENILCIDCQQYIKATNANLHSLFCFQNIEMKGVQAKNDFKSRLRNIIFFLSDEMARIKRKENFVDGVFWDNCEELKKCLHDIMECKREIEVHSLINRLHYVNSQFDHSSNPHAQEIKKLGVKAEEDLMS